MRVLLRYLVKQIESEACGDSLNVARYLSPRLIGQHQREDAL